MHLNEGKFSPAGVSACRLPGCHSGGSWFFDGALPLQGIKTLACGHSHRRKSRSKCSLISTTRFLFSTESFSMEKSPELQSQSQALVMNPASLLQQPHLSSK